MKTKEIIIQEVFDDIYKIIDKINKIQEEVYVEDLDYIKIHLENAINYKEIQEENVKGDEE